MNLELFQSILPAAQFALEVYLFGDGEVLLNVPRHLAMVSRIYQQNPGCALGFSTNGRLLTPDVYELYSVAGIRYIQVSVDAVRGIVRDHAPRRSTSLFAIWKE